MNPNSTFLETDYIVNVDFFETIKDIVTCCICTGIINDPIQCSTCENSFCNTCIVNWIKKSKTCPFKCKKIELKAPSRIVKNILDKLIFKCPTCKKKNISYSNIIEHLLTCGKPKKICQCEEGEIEIDDDSSLKNELKSLYEEKYKLLSQIYHKKIVFDKKAILYDKCVHFLGNYKPIFTCCNKAYPCYLCHNEYQEHPYEYSNKVICLNCGNIYEGSACPKCHITQVYKKKF